MYEDEFIEYWADIYQKAEINEYQLSFDEFLLEPEQNIKAIGIGEIL